MKAWMRFRITAISKRALYAIATGLLCIWLGHAPAIAQLPPSLAENIRRHGREQVIFRMEQNWEQEYEEYFGSNLGNVTLGVTEIGEALEQLQEQTETPTALLYLSTYAEDLGVMLVLPGGELIMRAVPEAGRDTLMAVVEEFSQAIASPTALGASKYLPAAQQLYEWIVGPVEAELDANQIDTILFCVGAGLRTLPFAALHDGERFLIEKYNPVRIPAFNLIETDNRSVLSRVPIAALGASEFAEQVPLPAVPVELETIADRWLDRAYLNEGFTFDALRRTLAIGRYRVIHLATHAEFKPGKPEQSYIQLWNERLTLDRLPELDWGGSGVDLLVLSACQTALGDRDAELGFAGLAFQTGVDTVVASLWSVSDTGTLALMSEFYQQLRQVSTTAKALQQAQLALLRQKVRVEGSQLRGTTRGVDLPPELADNGNDSNFAHPFFWAAFTVVGSP